MKGNHLFQQLVIFFKETSYLSNSECQILPNKEQFYCDYVQRTRVWDSWMKKEEQEPSATYSKAKVPTKWSKNIWNRKQQAIWIWIYQASQNDS